jgi:hypothetical protein
MQVGIRKSMTVIGGSALWSADALPGRLHGLKFDGAPSHIGVGDAKAPTVRTAQFFIAHRGSDAQHFIGSGCGGTLRHPGRSLSTWGQFQRGSMGSTTRRTVQQRIEQFWHGAEEHLFTAVCVRNQRGNPARGELVKQGFCASIGPWTVIRRGIEFTGPAFASC